MTAPRSVSVFCAFHKEGVHCQTARARKVSILPGMEAVICVCEEHFARLQQRAQDINEELQRLREGKEEVVERRVAPLSRCAAEIQIFRGGQSSQIYRCRRKPGHVDYNGKPTHYYYSRSETIYWDDETGLHSNSTVAA